MALGLNTNTNAEIVPHIRYDARAGRLFRHLLDAGQHERAEAVRTVFETAHPGIVDVVDHPGPGRSAQRQLVPPGLEPGRGVSQPDLADIGPAQQQLAAPAGTNDQPALLPVGPVPFAPGVVQCLRPAAIGPAALPQGLQIEPGR